MCPGLSHAGRYKGEHPFLSSTSAGGGPVSWSGHPAICSDCRLPSVWEERPPPPGEGQDGKESVTGRGLAGDPRDTKPSHKDALKVAQATSP